MSENPVQFVLTMKNAMMNNLFGQMNAIFMIFKFNFSCMQQIQLKQFLKEVVEFSRHFPFWNLKLWTEIKKLSTEWIRFWCVGFCTILFPLFPFDSVFVCFSVQEEPEFMPKQMMLLNCETGKWAVHFCVCFSLNAKVLLFLPQTHAHRHTAYANRHSHIHIECKATPIAIQQQSQQAFRHGNVRSLVLLENWTIEGLRALLLQPRNSHFWYAPSEVNVRNKFDCTRTKKN